MVLIEKLFPVNEPIPPHTDEWYMARLGRITASSRAGRIASGNPTVLNAVLAELRYELEYGEPYSKFKGNRHTAHGTRFEEQAFREYDLADLEMTEKVYEPGFMVHPEIPILAATPDFLEGEDTIGEIKCPSKPGRHLAMWHHGMDAQYLYQVQAQSLVTGRPRIVFISYDPRAVLQQRLYVEHQHAQPDIQQRILHNASLIWTCLKDGGEVAPHAKIESGVPNLF